MLISTVEQVSCIRQMFEEKWECSEAVQRYLQAFRKPAVCLGRRFGITCMCLNRTCIEVRIGKNLSVKFLVSGIVCHTVQVVSVCEKYKLHTGVAGGGEGGE